MGSVSVVWESIVPAVIQNCFANCGFSTASSVNADDDEENYKATLVVPVRSTSFLMSTNLPLLLLFRHRVWMAEALASSMW
jgi:hypothetical protein